LISRCSNAARSACKNTLEEFDWIFCAVIRKKQILDLAVGQFVRCRNELESFFQNCHVTSRARKHDDDDQSTAGELGEMIGDAPLRRLCWTASATPQQLFAAGESWMILLTWNMVSSVGAVTTGCR